MRLRLPAVVARVIEFVPSSLVDESTRVAVKVPPAVTLIAPSAVLILVSVMASVSSMSILPAALVVTTAETTAVSSVIGPTAVAVRRFALNTVEVWPSSVIAPAETRFTSFWLPAVTVVTEIAPPAFTLMAPSDVTTLKSAIVLVSSMSITPAAVVVTSAEPTAVSRVTGPAAVAVK